MRFPLTVTSSMRLELDAFVVFAEYGKRGPVTFMIDTGSQVSSIGEKDIRALEVEPKWFQRYTGPPIVGIGGRARTLVIPNVTLILTSEDGEQEIHPGYEFLYHQPRREKKRRRRGVQVYEEKAVLRAPASSGWIC